MFPNLGGDALLLAPCPTGPVKAYAHLAAFLRGAPEAQVLELWRVLGRHVEHRVGKRLFWVSTSGLGVYWLHLRLDDIPKYYQHAPYRTSHG